MLDASAENVEIGSVTGKLKRRAAPSRFRGTVKRHFQDGPSVVYSNIFNIPVQPALSAGYWSNSMFPYTSVNPWQHEALRSPEPLYQGNCTTCTRRGVAVAPNSFSINNILGSVSPSANTAFPRGTASAMGLHNEQPIPSSRHAAHFMFMSQGSSYASHSTFLPRTPYVHELPYRNPSTFQSAFRLPYKYSASV